jgi:hypothetical protein
MKILALSSRGKNANRQSQNEEDDKKPPENKKPRKKMDIEIDRSDERYLQYGIQDRISKLRFHRCAICVSYNKILERS